MNPKSKYFFLLLISIFCHFISNAQMAALGKHYNVDSLQTNLKTDKEDTNKANDLNYLSRELATQNPDTCILLSNQALQISEKLNFDRGRAGSYIHLGWLYFVQGNFPKALENYTSALAIAEKIKDTPIVSFCYGFIGQVYESEKDYSKALDYYFKSLAMDQKMGNKWGVARNFGIIGIVFNDRGKYSIALDDYFKAMKLCEEVGNKNGVAVWLSNMGGAYKDSAMSLNGNENKILRDTLFRRSMDYSFQALKIFEELGNKWSSAEINTDLGAVYCEIKKYKESYDYLYRGLALSQKIGGMDDVKNSYERLSTLYEKSNIPLCDSIGGKLLSMEEMRLRALYYHKRFISIRDTLFSQERHKEILNVDFERKETAAKAQHEKEMAVEEADKKRQQIILAFVVCGLLFVLVVAGFIFRTLKVTRKQKQLIEIKSRETEEQKKIIEEKNKDILDSIHYAKRIQQSLMPTDKFIDKTLGRLRKK